jgi:DNA (cytosine-5)-methyltransferase 1
VDRRVRPDRAGVPAVEGGGVTFRYLDVCAGISAASQAFRPLGWQCAGYSEIELFPRAVLEQRWGAVAVDWDHRWAEGLNYAPLFGDFTQIEAHHVGPVDLLVGGTPCQDFSVAGLRAGLAGARGNLTLEFLRLAERVRAPRILWENVPGVLSSDGGRAFGAFLGGLGELGYRWAYRVLDAQYVRVGGFERAVPQRRRRVFVVGYLGDGPNPAAVLFEPESLRGNPAPRREAGQGSAPILAARTRGGGGLGTDFDCDGGLISAPVAPTLNAHFGDKQGLEDQHINGGGCSSPSVSMCLNAGSMGRRDAETETLIPVNRCGFDVAHSLRAEGFDASEDGTGRQNLVPIAFDTTQITSPANYSNPKSGDACHPLAAGGHAPAVAIQGTVIGRDAGGPQGSGADDGGAMLTLTKCDIHAVAFSFKDSGNDATVETSPTLRSLRAYDANGGSQMAVATGWAVRRLTPTECERLQGFPDGWTDIEWRKKPAPDGPRYKALGNSMAVNVVRWIGERIQMVEAAFNRKETTDV